MQLHSKEDDGNTEVFYLKNAIAIFHHLHMNRKLKGSKDKEPQKYNKEKK